MKNLKANNTVLSTIGSLMISGLVMTNVAQAETNQFGVSELKSGYMQLAEASCGEGKCGGDKKASAEAKCGEGKCGGDKKASSEAKCGEGKCGGDKKASAEAKCGEGKCGGDKKASVEAKCGEGKCGA